MEVRDGPEDWQSADLAAGLVRAPSEPPRFGP
jgi:hypothetical protein